ncbi:MAG: hypothetical protein MJ103_02885 [Saccharofermentans sp.]|nr:hypothetical protein [Saccharofermentans sp.]
MLSDELKNAILNEDFYMTNGMLNRIINVTEGNLKAQYIALLQDVASRTDVDQYIRDVAQDFVEYQSGS